MLPDPTSYIHNDLDLKSRGWYFKHLTFKLCVLFLVIHFSFIFVFYRVGFSELAFINIGSVIVYILCFALLQRNWTNIAFALITAEVITHAFFCSQFLGDAGFTDALLFLPILFFVHPSSLKVKIPYFFMILITYIWMRYNDHFHSPLYEIEGNLVEFFAVATSVLIIVIDCYIAYYAYSIIKKQETIIKQNK